ncbi:ABC transporter substrate-binding protein, partial [Paraburkholderia tuberum]
MSRVNLRRKQVLVSFALPTIIVAFAFSGIAVTAHADTVRITVSHYSDATGPYFNKMAHEFEKATPGTTIKIEEVNWDALQQKLQTDIMGGANSDLAIVATRWLLDFVHDDVAEPLDGYMDASFRDRFIGQILAPGEIKGKVCGLPLAASTRALYYNKDLLAKAGYPNGPKTW